MRRAHCRMLLAWGLASQSLVTAEVPVDELCAMPAADQVVPPPADASWIVLEGCVDDPRLEPGTDQDFQQKWPRMQQCGEAAREIVRTGTDTVEEELAEDLPPDQ